MSPTDRTRAADILARARALRVTVTNVRGSPTCHRAVVEGVETILLTSLEEAAICDPSVVATLIDLRLQAARSRRQAEGAARRLREAEECIARMSEGARFASASHHQAKE